MAAIAQIERLIEPSVRALGFDLVRARLTGRSPPTLQVMIERVDDLSWWTVSGDTGWFDVDALPATVDTLLAEIGRTYVPFMLANEAALLAGDDEVVCEIDGHEYRQAPFKYQVKCLAWLRDAYRALDPAAWETVDRLLAGTGCEPLVT